MDEILKKGEKATNVQNKMDQGMKNNTAVVVFQQYYIVLNIQMWRMKTCEGSMLVGFWEVEFQLHIILSFICFCYIMIKYDFYQKNN